MIWTNAMGKNIAINLRWRPTKLEGTAALGMIRSPFFACNVEDVICPSQKYFLNRVNHENFALGTAPPAAAIVLHSARTECVSGRQKGRTCFVELSQYAPMKASLETLETYRSTKS